MNQVMLINTNFDIKDICLPYKEDIIDFYFKNINTEESYNVLYTNQEFTDKVKPRIIEAIHDIFDVGKPISNSQEHLNIYVQNNEHYYQKIHHHPTTSSLSSIFYLDVPEEGGDLDIFYPHPDINEFVIDRISVEENMLYFFPYWMYHSPVPQSDKKYRISFNYDYFCRERPILKKTGTMW